MTLRFNLKKILINASLFLLGFNYIIYNALDIQGLKLPLRLAAIFLAILCIILFKNNSTNIINIFLILVCIVQISIGNTDALNFLTFILYSIILDDNIQESCKDVFKVYSLLIVLYILLLISGIVENNIYFGMEGRKRETLGFLNTNAASLFFTTYLYFINLSRDYKLPGIILTLILNYIIYYYTDSRTTFFSMLVFCIFLAFHDLLGNNAVFEKIIGKSCIYLINICFAISLISIFIIDRLIFLDNILSLRITLIINNIRELSVLNYLFGGVQVNIDSFYHVFLFSFGLFLYIIVWIITLKAARQLKSNNQFKYLFFITSSFLMGVTESSIYRVEIIGFIILWKLILSYYNYDSKEGLVEAI